MLSDIQNLSHLTHLSLNDCYFQFDRESMINIINSIWSLPNLSHCHLNIRFARDCYLTIPTVTSVSIEHLSIVGTCCCFEYLSRLYEHTPHLRSLRMKIWDSLNNSHLPFPLLSITKLKLEYQTSQQSMMNLLHKLPNLEHLSIETIDIRVDGNFWEHIITNYLPKLKLFRLKMQFAFVDHDYMEDEIDQLLHSYRSRFWLNERQWFVRCYWKLNDENASIYLHTLPYGFDDLRIDIREKNILFKSTTPNDENFCSYYHVRHLFYCYSSSRNINQIPIHFSNIRHLTLTLPYNDRFQSVLPCFNHLIFLEVRIDTWSQHEHDLLQLQALLDRAPHLYSLKFSSWPSFNSQTKQTKKRSQVC
ncbi:unnamed protein product [Rotaria sordida]|uniref:Uncharacterized protein n=1 Tax=Rotaria sordida TaxID=392033 RepID=A0A820AQ73_9BILA|nr:unnamed protein product [Rotaria sordida]